MLAAVVFGAVIAGCGGASQGPTVASVGPATIGRSAVARWAHAIERGTTPAAVDGDPQGTPTERAVSFLISAAWLHAEAVAHGVAASSHAVGEGLRAREQADGKGEFESALRASGLVVDDLKSEIEAELNTAALRSVVSAQLPPVTQAEVLAYYRAHPTSFQIPGVRYVQLIEELSSPVAARALVSRIGTGKRFAALALHEKLPVNYARQPGTPLDIQHVTSAIFAAKPGVVSAPMRLNGHWTVFVVTGITATRPKPLSEVRAKIVGLIAAQHRALAFREFASQYRQRWRVRTSCRSGYVVPGCFQYRGTAAPIIPFASG